MNRTLGVIADDLTGATDAASAIRRRGLRVALAFGVPTASSYPEVDVVVVALKIRSEPVADALRAVTATMQAFKQSGVDLVAFKYCSTFDSTPQGNIGPIADELIRSTGAELFVHAPGYPDNARTVYQGHLFVGSAPLDESPMRNHPLNPMTDANLLRLLAPQTAHPVSLLPFQTVDGIDLDAPAEDILAEFSSLGAPRHVVADTVVNRHFDAIAALRRADVIMGGGAPICAAICAYEARGWTTRVAAAPQSGELRSSRPTGAVQKRAVIAGSASEATKRQIASFGGAILRMPPGELADHRRAAREALAWTRERWQDGPVLITTTERRADSATEVAGRPAGAVVERGLGAIARELADDGADALVVAGGETSGAVAQALELTDVVVAQDISTGVPWTHVPDRHLSLAFKSGNFGDEDFFDRAFRSLSV